MAAIAAATRRASLAAGRLPAGSAVEEPLGILGRSMALATGVGATAKAAAAVDEGEDPELVAELVAKGPAGADCGGGGMPRGPVSSAPYSVA